MVGREAREGQSTQDIQKNGKAHLPIKREGTILEEHAFDLDSEWIKFQQSTWHGVLHLVNTQ